MAAIAAKGGGLLVRLPVAPSAPAEVRTAPADDDDAEARYLRRVQRAKRRARSELRTPEAWQQHGYHATYASLWAAEDHVPRIDYDAVSEAEFIERYERPAVPVVIRGACAHWPATERWTVERLAAAYGDRRLKVGEDDDGNSVRLKLRYFLQYAATTTDDSPLYVFDGSFGERLGTAPLLRDYDVPKYFRDDLFRLAGERRRPPYRWVVLGPARSGTNIHIDPLGTSTWNALLHGHKRWVLFPPATPKAALRTPKTDGEAASWFTHIYPLTKAPDWPHAPPIDLLQRPGETVFVPGGWWHVVLNLDMTIAVTQNFCSRTNFPTVWPRTRRSRPKMAAKLLAQLQTTYPDLHALALELNAQPETAMSGGAGSGGYGSSSSSEGSSSSSSSSDHEDDDDGDNNPDGSDCGCATCRATAAATAPREEEDVPPPPPDKRARTDP